jgi:hypothetical protein
MERTGSSDSELPGRAPVSIPGSSTREVAGQGVFSPWPAFFVGTSRREQADARVRDLEVQRSDLIGDPTRNVGEHGRQEELERSIVL